MMSLLYHHYREKFKEVITLESTLKNRQKSDAYGVAKSAQLKERQQ